MSDRRRDFARDGLRFAARHVWSLLLSGLSGISFLHLASEVREAELGAFDRPVADWLEAGTPLIKSEGMEVVRQLKKSFPGAKSTNELMTRTPLELRSPRIDWNAS